ncbi:nucleotidyltransferase domain-containing protein [Methanoregula formicica]|nr:nucleotidyltransferase domain-containing protein [Methanoregula formicica]
MNINQGFSPRVFMQKRGKIQKEALNEILRCIVDVAKPEKILFGSAARNEMGQDSDIVLLVIKSGDYNPHTIAGDINLNLFGIGQAIDLIVVTPDRVRKYADSLHLVFYPALHEGRVLYDVSTVASG